MANEHVHDEEFSLKDHGILYPYIREQRNMSVSASFARDKNRPPVELSVQEIADHLPIDFQYANKGKEKDDAGCYLGSHLHALQYARKRIIPTEGLGRMMLLFHPSPYRIGHITRVRTEDSDADRVNLEEENLVTEEELKEILRRKPIIGAIRLFQGKGMDDKGYDGSHSVLIIGYGIMNGIKHFIIKNTYSVDWGDEGYGRVKRDLLYRLCYPNNVYMFPYDPRDVIVKKRPKNNPSSSGSKKKKGW